MITINVDEDVYRRFKNAATRTDRSASELIREAMSDYATEMIPEHTSIFDGEPASVGSIYQLPANGEDLLDEMLS